MQIYLNDAMEWEKMLLKIISYNFCHLALELRHLTSHISQMSFR